MNLAHLLGRAASIHGSAPAIAHGHDVVWSYAELAARVASRAAGLQGQLGLRAGDAVGVCMANHPAYLEALFAIWHAGLVAVPVNAKLHPSELAWILGDAEARVCLSAGGLVDVLAPAAADVTVIDVDGDGWDRWARLGDADPLPAPVDLAPEAIAWRFYTSGTTGRPKGALLSHRNLLAMTLAYFTDIDAIEPGHRMIHAAPMSHGSGLYALPHVAAGATNVVPRSGGFDPEEVFELVRRWPQASFFMAPTMVHRLVQHPGDGTGLRTIVYGGGPMYLEDLRAGLDRFGPCFAQIYGQGEAPMTITAVSRAMHADSDHPEYWARLGTVGVARTGVEVRVVDSDDRPLPPGEVGEIVCRGDVVMAGYAGRPEATAKTLRSGWLHTGDLGSFDARSWLTLQGRTHDLIISGGTNIYPREVEEVLLGDPAVAEVAVVGMPDREWGERVVAFVVPVTGETVDVALLDARCLAHIARFKRPREIRIVHDLPKNAYGKVVKSQLQGGG